MNGFFILYFYLRDKPNLVVNPLHPELYQWWFKLPSGEHEGQQTRRYGFLLYAGVANKGLRKTTLTEWRLRFKLAWWKPIELKPKNMPQPQVEISGQKKLFNVFGQKNHLFGDTTVVEPGESTAGMIFYTYECYGAEDWDPPIQEDDTLEVDLMVEEVFGRTSKATFNLSKIEAEKVEEWVPGLLEMYEEEPEPPSTP